jgi:sugar lactone lactonase YvrE
MAVEVEHVWSVATALGEGPVWAAEEGALYWLDIRMSRVFRFTPADGTRQRVQLAESVTCMAPRARGGWVAAGRSGFALLDLERAALEPIVDPEADRPANRFNDGKCDAAGRFWAGTMDDAGEAETGALYRLDPGGSVARMDAGYVITNGPAFSPDGRTMLHNDTTRGLVYAFDYDVEAGAISNKRLFAEVPTEDGLPDGMTFDEEGCVWVALHGGSRVTRFDPAGRAVRAVPIPSENVTSCAFGGEALDTLYVTTATDGLYAFEPGVRGLPTEPFSG